MWRTRAEAIALLGLVDPDPVAFHLAVANVRRTQKKIKGKRQTVYNEADLRLLVAATRTAVPLATPEPTPSPEPPPPPPPQLELPTPSPAAAPMPQPASYQTRDEIDARILTHLASQSHPQAILDMQKALGMSQEKISKSIKRLNRADKIQRVRWGQGRHQRRGWRIAGTTAAMEADPIRSPDGKWVPTREIIALGIKGTDVQHHVRMGRLRRVGTTPHYLYNIADARKLAAKIPATAPKKRGPKPKAPAAPEASPPRSEAAIEKLNTELDREHTERQSVQAALQAVEAMAARIPDFYQAEFTRLDGGRLKADIKRLVTHTVILEGGGNG
jgi:hypothetical protein